MSWNFTKPETTLKDRLKIIKENKMNIIFCETSMAKTS